MSRAKELLEFYESIKFDSVDFMKDLLDTGHRRGLNLAYDGDNNEFNITLNNQELGKIKVFPNYVQLIYKDGDSELIKGTSKIDVIDKILKLLKSKFM